MYKRQYYNMFFDDAVEPESLFGRLARTHENLLAVKVDGATKEEFVWGLRVGFLTYGIKNGTPAVYAALEQKTAGLIRATVSNISHASQSIVLRALNHPDFRKQQREKIDILRARAAVTAGECRKAEYADLWDVYPFNSGYFMCLRLKQVLAETVRQHLLEHHGLGIIALGEHVGWWHMAITWEPYFLMLLLIDFTLCAFVYLITWRIVRRFAWRGLAVCVAVAAVIGPARDYWYMQRFTEWGAYEPGIAPLLAVSATYVVMIILGHGVMRLIAGPSCADRLARRPWETILRSTDGRISVDESTANGKK